MAHYAYLDENNVVTHVIVGKDESDPPGDWENYYGAKRTSYNTKGGVYHDPATGEPGADQSKSFRKNFAGTGYIYDPALDGFIPPQPFPSWTLDEDTCLWVSPIPRPDVELCFWDEALQEWNTELTRST